jgi:hypothetical protein
MVGSEMFGHLYHHDFSTGTNLPVRGKGHGDHDFPPFYLLGPAPQYQGTTERCRTKIVHMEGSGHEAKGRLGIHGTPLSTEGGRRGRARSVAVDQGGDQPPIDVSWDGDMVGFGLEGADAFLAIPVTLDLEAVFVQPSTPVAVTQIVRIEVLKCFSGHRWLLLLVFVLVEE